MIRRRLQSAEIGYGRSLIMSGSPLTDMAAMFSGWVYDGTTRATGGADPNGGTSGIVITDTAQNVLHRFYQQPTPQLIVGQPWLCSVYFKPGTYTGGMSFGIFDTVFNEITCTNTGTPALLTGQATQIQAIAAGNGFFRVSFLYSPQANVAAGAGFWIINFGTLGQQGYLGTVQNQTFWAPSMVLAYT